MTNSSGDRPFFQTPLNPSSQIVSPVTLLISHYLYTNIHIVHVGDVKFAELVTYRVGPLVSAISLATCIIRHLITYNAYM